MNTTQPTVLEKLRRYHFELKHLLVLFVVLLICFLLISFAHKNFLQNLLLTTQDWYQRESAEQMANLTATSLELLVETTQANELNSPAEAQKIVQAFNIILSQQKLQQNIESICILIEKDGNIYTIDDGKALYQFFVQHRLPTRQNKPEYRHAVELYEGGLKKAIQQTEHTYSVSEKQQSFHVFVPFVPRGEFVGTIYVKNTPDFSFISNQIMTQYDRVAFLFVALVVIGLLAMFWVSSSTVQERDAAQQMLFKERERYLTEKINREKEALFTRRIYHTHHKAEKVMGFIKEDLRNLHPGNIDEVKYRVTRYANFVARVIYDMKWFDPPLQTIRNPAYRTNINEVIEFLVNHLFQRTSDGAHYRFNLRLDPNLPPVPINEFVVWEIMEPLIQNCIEHANAADLHVSVTTRYDVHRNQGFVEISDNGQGIAGELLEEVAPGMKRIFQEHVTTKPEVHGSGYGCYIAYEICQRRCGWRLDVENLPEGGCRYVICIPNLVGTSTSVQVPPMNDKTV